jgi:hypothetical protein
MARLTVGWFDSWNGDAVFVPYAASGTASFSADGQTLFYTQTPIRSVDEQYWKLSRTAAPCVVQLSSGLWQGTRADGAEASIMFNLDLTMSMSLDTMIYDGSYLLYNGLIEFLAYPQDIVISKDGTRLIIIDFLGNAGEVVELVRG